MYQSSSPTTKEVSKTETGAETSSASSTQGENHDESRKQRKGAIRKVRYSWEDRRKDYRRKKIRIASWQTEKYMEIMAVPGEYTVGKIWLNVADAAILRTCT